MPLAPIVLFVYNRPELTRMTLEALANNELAYQSTLYIYCDGPKESAGPETLSNIAEVRKITRERKWCGEVIIYERDKNLGLAKSIITGVTDIVNLHGTVIVLEDDLQTSRFFLKYMNDSLTVYEEDEKVLSIGACNFFAFDEETPETFFIPIPDCWGWATWKNRWSLFEPDGKKLYQELKDRNLLGSFNLQGNYPFEEMLVKQINQQVNSWAIRWQAVAYINNRIALYPKYSVTIHRYSDEATHANGYDNSEMVKFCVAPISVNRVPIELRPEIIRKMELGYKITANSGSLIKRVIKFIIRKIGLNI